MEHVARVAVEVISAMQVEIARRQLLVVLIVQAVVRFGHFFLVNFFRVIFITLD
jgi:hypothetical protein